MITWMGLSAWLLVAALLVWRNWRKEQRRKREYVRLMARLKMEQHWREAPQNERTHLMDLNGWRK